MKKVLKAKWKRYWHCFLKFRGHRMTDYYIQKEMVIFGKVIPLRKKFIWIGCECGECFFDNRKYDDEK